MLIGREKEQAQLKSLLASKQAEFLALIGRRRVGKTFLTTQFFSAEDNPFFYVSGIQNGRLKEQINLFYQQIGVTFYHGAPLKPQKQWIDAYADLTKAFDLIPKNKKIILFFDEFPWMATKRSRLLQALDYYWNRYWSHDPRIKLIICGSSASWIIRKIINDKGGLHNRVTKTIHLEPFTLRETKLFLKSRAVNLNTRHILDIYMAVGGIPHYLAMINPGDSAHQSIGKLMFRKDGALVKEFNRLFDSLFIDAEHYVNLIKTLAMFRNGLSQANLIIKSKEPAGGRTTQRLKELEEAGFIMSFIPYGRVEKGIYYKIIDEYTLFYLNWIKPALPSINKIINGEQYWLSCMQSSKWQSWAGYTFEAVCFKHIDLIARALEIPSGALIGSWKHISADENDQGAQIDLLFDRADYVISICEIKYNDHAFLIDKKYAKELQNKVEVYQKQTKTNKQIFINMVTVAGIKPSMYSEELISKVATLEDLFKKDE